MLDWLIVAGYLAGTVAVGLFAGRSKNTSEGFLLGQRVLPWWMLLISIVATETSTVTFLSLPGESFKAGGDFTFLQLTFGYIVGRLLVVQLLLPLYFSGRFFTAYEVLQERFGSTVRLTASLTFLVMRTLADGLRLLLTGLLIESATGLDFLLCVSVLAASTAIYAAIGGVSSVVVNDCLQFFAYMLGAAVTLWLILGSVPGGFAGMWEFGVETGRLQTLDFSGSLTSPSITFWSGLVGRCCITMASHGADQLMVQRYLCTKSQRAAGWSLALSGPLVALQFLFFLVIGLALAYFYNTHQVDYVVDQNDRAFIGYIVHQLAPGLRPGHRLGAGGLDVDPFQFAQRLGRRDGQGRGETLAGGSLGRTVGPCGPGVDGSVCGAANLGGGAGLRDRAQELRHQRRAGNRRLLDGIVAGSLRFGVIETTNQRGGRPVRHALRAGLLQRGGFCMHLSWPWYSLIGSAVTLSVGFLVSLFIPPSVEKA